MDINNNSNKFLYPRGSEWRKWDLHIHTKSDSNYSNHPDYKISQKERNDQEYPKIFIEHIYGIDNLGAIAITDHNTSEWVDKFILQNNNYNPSENRDKITIFPGVEIESGEGIHLLVIFNPDTKKDNIKRNCRKVTWKETIEHFITYIKSSNENNKNGLTEDILKKAEEWDAICIYAHVTNDKGFFKLPSGDNKIKLYNNPLTQIFQIPYHINDLGCSNIMNGKDPNYKNKKICQITCSDAKRLKAIGTNNCWIKADSTFEGLKLAIYEPEERVNIRDEPDIIKNVRENKTKFIKEIKINQIDNYNEEYGIWFKDINIPINPGFVAIIGNKGSGKSALTDIISLCGNSHLYNEFSFLNKEKFLKDDLAKNFKATLTWESEESVELNLSDNCNLLEPERVRYLPQNYFERLSNNLNPKEFGETLEKVIFLYIPEAKRLEKNTFDDLIQYEKNLFKQDINNFKSEIEKLNKEIINLEKKSHPDYKKEIEGKLKLKNRELEEHIKIKPQEAKNPKEDPNLSQENSEKQKELDLLNQELGQINETIKEKENELKKTYQSIKEIEGIKNYANNIKEIYNKFIEDYRDKLIIYQLDIFDIIKFEFKFDLLDNKIKELQASQKDLEKLLYTEDDIKTRCIEDQEKLREGSLIIKKNNIVQKVNDIKGKLDEKQRLYQEYLENLKRWEERKKEIEGDEDSIDSLKWLDKEIQFIDNELQDKINELRNKRLSITDNIIKKKNEVLEIYKDFQSAINTRIKEIQAILNDYKINIDVNFVINTNFNNIFLSYINQKIKGSFNGIDEGNIMLNNIIKSHNFNDNNGIKDFLNEIIEYLEYDKRDEVKKNYIQNQILDKNKWLDFYNYLFSLDYIEPAYKLQLNGKDLSILSPGERGALLIVFYLLLDREYIPLIIDQPEENLDNESVFKILKNIIKYVKKERQVIAVTHNPNLAIAGDAEQIIFVNIDKENNNKFSFESGSIENPIINKHASDILEGTLDAFNIRKLKYLIRD
mgnify:FL=1